MAMRMHLCMRCRSRTGSARPKAENQEEVLDEIYKGAKAAATTHP